MSLPQPVPATDLDIVGEALAHLRDKYVVWIRLRRSTEAEVELAKIKISLIDKEMAERGLI